MVRWGCWLFVSFSIDESGSGRTADIVIACEEMEVSDMKESIEGWGVWMVAQQLDNRVTKAIILVTGLGRNRQLL